MSVQKIAVVTGGNRGIGFEVARQLAQTGPHVVLTARDPEQGRTAAEQLRQDGLSVSFWPLEVTDEEAVANLAEHVERDFGRLDILVNNAGVALDPFRPALSIDWALIDTTLRTNVQGAFLCCQKLIPIMHKNNYGRVVNISSNLGSLELMGGLTLAYRMSKAALNVLTRVLAGELKDQNILINSMCPGWVRTGLGGPNAPKTPEEGADTAVWLATLSDEGPRGGFFKDRAPLPW